MEKTIEEGIRKTLLSEVPERYHYIRGGNDNCTLLKLDVNIIVHNTVGNPNNTTSPNAIKNLCSILNSLHQESGAFCQSIFCL